MFRDNNIKLHSFVKNALPHKSCTQFVKKIIILTCDLSTEAKK